MDVSQLNRSRVNESRLNCSVLNASGFDGSCRRSRVPGIGADIMKSMVLWYDLKKQGATNENMAENPVLRDLSGNGHDATCYNFAWSGMSGVDGYSQNYNKRWYIDDTRVSATVTNVQINVTSVLQTVIGVYYQSNGDEVAFTVPSYKVRVSGLTDGQTVTYIDGLHTVSYTIDSDGEYTLPQIDFTAQGGYYGFLLNKVQESCNITIEQLPLYPNALVSDGVDDYCLVEGLPLLNKEDGYTVIAKRKWLDEDNEGTTAFASKATTANGLEGAFMFEYKDSSGTRKATRSFSVATIMEEFEKNDITYQSSSSYNRREIIAGGSIDNNDMVLFRYSSKDDSYYGKFALYSLLLFNRDLTTEEIEWVKTNLIETEQ